MRWTGNGVTDGTAVSGGNVNTAGNGDTVAFATSGTGTMVFAGEGIDASGAVGAGLRRIDATYAVGARQAVQQVFYTPQQDPTTALEQPMRIMDGGQVTHQTDGTIRLYDSVTAAVQTGPTLVLNQRYQIDLLALQNQGTRTTTNGRLVVRVKNLNDATWNTTGDWYYDSGYTVNAGTVDLTGVRFGKQGSTSAIASGTPSRFEQLGWDTVATDLTSVTTRAAVEEFFMTSPYVSGMRWTGNGLSDGTAITSTALANTVGNGDTVAYAVSGSTASMDTFGDGFTIYGAAGDLRRLDCVHTAVRTAVYQIFYTPAQHPTAGNERFVIPRRSGSAAAAGFVHQTNGRLGATSATGSVLQQVPVAHTNGHRFLVNLLVAQDTGTRSTTNGRVVMKITDLNDPAWNTTGYWFYDSGYAIDAGTTDLNGCQYGKCTTGVEASGTPALLEQLGWNPIGTDVSGATSEAAICAYFMASPYTATTAWLGA